MADATSADRVLERVEALLERIERLVPAAPASSPDWSASIAFRWRKRNGAGVLQPVVRPQRVALSDLRAIDRQKAEADRNTRQFVRGLPANNVLLSGSRGTGKSSLVKALLNEYADEGLRLIEVDKHDLIDLPDIVDGLFGRPERFILFCDDLSFESDDASYKALKAVLDGSVAAPPENVLVYATSNRRHLMPEYMRENLEAHQVDGEIHHAEAVEEKISLSERFGLWLSFRPFPQDAYLDIVHHWLGRFGVLPEDRPGGSPERPDQDGDEMRAEALRWALVRGSRSGRSAYQFARDWAGRRGLGR